MTRKGKWWHRNNNKDEVFSHRSENVVLSHEAVPESVTLGHKSGEFAGRVGRMSREESTDEVGWEGTHNLLSMT